MVKIVYLKTLETTMRRLRIWEEKSTILSPLHIGGKQDVYIESDKLDTTKSTKMDVVNKEMVISNCYQKPVMKNRGQKLTLQKINYENEVTQKNL